MWVLLLLEHVDWVFALQQTDRKGRRGLGDVVKHEESLIAAPLEDKRANT